MEHRVTTLGPAAMLAKIRFMEKYPDAKSTAKQFHFMGDPALILSKGSGLSDVAGELPSDRTWGGYTTITGDVTVPAGQTLEIKPYAFVEFENDAELKVYGTLIASGDVFSANADIVFYEGAQVTIAGDLTLPLGAELTIKPGIEVEFLANTDGTGGGRDRTRSELIVEGTLDASASRITFRSANDTPSNDDWYGIRVASGGSANLSGATVQDGSRCVQDEGGTLTMTNATLSNCGATVTLDPTTPYVGEEITAILEAPSADITTEEQWQWQRRRRSTDAWTDITSATTSSYRPMAEDLDSQLRATVRYQAEDNVYPHAQSAATEPVGVGRPSAPRNLMATPSSTGPVALAWDAPSSNRGSDITDYQYRYRAVGSKTWLPSANGASVGLTTRHTVQEPTNGVAYIFEVWAVNAAGAGDTTRVGVGTITLSSLSPRVEVPLRSTLMDPDGGEIDVRWDRSFTGSTSLRDPTAERASGALMTTFTPGRWNVGSRMQVEAFYDDAQGRGQRAYSVKTAPVQDRLEVSYESATYQASEGGSSVSIRVRLSGPDDQALTIPIKVRAGDNTESGDYAVKGLSNKQLLFPAGTTERSFTIRALADPDSADETVLLSFGALPAGVVVGTTRQATVTLLDDDDRALSLMASGGDSQVALSWTAPTNSATIAGYQVRQRISDSGQDWSIWATVPGGISARSKTIAGLTNGVTYQFQVQAIDRQGTSVAVSNVESAMPQANDFSFVPPRVMKTATVGLQFIFNRPNPVNGTGTITYATTSTGGGLTATRTGISGIPTTAGRYDFTWTATDGAGATAIFTLTLTVRSQNSAPSFDDDRVSYSAQAGSTVNETLPEAEGASSYETSGTVPGYVTVNTTTRALSIQPENTHVGDDGDDSFTWRARNTHGTDDLTVYIEVTAIPTVPAPGLPRNFAADTGSPLTAGSIDLDWDPPTSGGTPTGYRVEYRFSSGSWLLGATPTLTNVSLILPRAGALYQFHVRAENSAGNSGWVETTGTTSGQAPPPETEYAYRASQSAPLFDTVASGTPDNWSSGELTWTDAAPRVWSIQRTRPSGGTWSEWGTLEKHRERPAAYETFYRRASSAPSTPGTQTGTNLSTPSTWQTTPPTATATQGVWSTTANRAKGDTQWVFTVPTQETPPTSGTAPGLPRNFDADTGSPLTAGSIDLDWDAPTRGGTPTGYRVEYRFSSGSWLLGATPTLTNVSLILPRAGALYQFHVRAENSAGNSGWVETTGTTSGQAQPPETEYAYRLHTSGTTAPTFTASTSTVPTGWYSSSQTPHTHARYEWRISRSRPAGGSWSSWGSASVVSRYTETQTAYKRNDSGTTAPAFSSTASGTPYGWSSSQPSPTSSNRYVWSITRTRPAGGSWSSWGSAEVVSKYTERQTAYQRNDSGTTAPAFSSTASGVPYGWSSSQPSPTSSNRYVWSISRTRPAGGSWSSWGSATVVSKYTERQTAYKRNDSGTTAPAFSSTASGVPYGWSSSQPSPTSSNRYVWSITRTRPAGESWSSWGSAEVVSKYTERQTAYKRNDSGTTAPAFSSTASGVPYGWSSSQPSPTSSNRYVWSITRTRPAGGSWSSWGSAEVVSKYTERQTAYKRNDSGTTAPAFSSTSSGVPYGWSSSQPSPTSSNRYVWSITRTRPAGGSWSSWGSAEVVSKYTERQTAYKRNDSGTTAPAFSSTSSGVPYGWSSSQPSPTSSNRYVWSITRTRPAGESWSSWGSAEVVSKYTERQTAYKRNDSGTTAPAFSSTASGVPYGWSSSQPSPTSSNRYVWSITRTRPAGESWSSWGSAEVVSKYTERQTAYKRNDSGTTAPAFSSTASGVPYGWSSSQPSPTSSNRYVWSISRTRPAGGSWSSWGSASVVSKYTERQTAFRLHTSGTTAPTFTASASGVPSGWSSTQPSPDPYAPYVWRISRTRPAGESWSNWGGATVVNTWTASTGRYRDGLKRLGNSYLQPPAFSGIPTGWSSARRTPPLSNRYEWRIRRMRLAGGS